MRAKQAPTIWNTLDLFRHSRQCGTEIKPGVWVPARPLGLDTIPARFRAAWLVFTGKADALLWPGQ